MNIFLFGAQGSGKSTIGTYLAKKLEVPFIATGDIFRELREEDSNLGKSVRALYDQGSMVSDEVTMEIVNKRINEKDAENGFILDGAPRNLNQEKLLTKKPELIVVVSLEEDKALKRLLERGRVDDNREAIKRRLSWHKEQVEPVIDYYRGQGIRTVEVDNTPPVEEVQKILDGLFKN